MRVLLQQHALVRRVAGHVERAVRDRLVVAADHAGVPVLVERAATTAPAGTALEREAREDEPEEVAVVGECLAGLPAEGDRLAGKQSRAGGQGRRES